MQNACCFLYLQKTWQPLRLRVVNTQHPTQRQESATPGPGETMHLSQVGRCNSKERLPERRLNRANTLPFFFFFLPPALKYKSETASFTFQARSVAHAKPLIVNPPLCRQIGLKIQSLSVTRVNRCCEQPRSVYNT